MASTYGPSMKSSFGIWIGLLCIVGIEVFLTYRGLSPGVLIASLLILAFMEATIAILYFMHLKYERPWLFWSLIPATIFVLFMMNHVWPDAYRLARLKLPIY
jgi:heme/copper-type cytochrome/quinol oxidase subunit 4